MIKLIEVTRPDYDRSGKEYPYMMAVYDDKDHPPIVDQVDARYLRRYNKTTRSGETEI